MGGDSWEPARIADAYAAAEANKNFKLFLYVSGVVGKTNTDK